MKKKEITAEVIHAEFDQATADLILEANAILKEAVKQVSPQAIATRLKSLGFTNTKFVQDQDLFVKTKEEAEIVLYYQQNYPFQKFITEDQLNQICEKYNLIFAPVGAYKENVPLKNLEEIERAPELKGEDESKDLKYATYKFHDISFPDGHTWMNKKQIEQLNEILGGKIEGHFRSQFNASDYVRKKYGDQMEGGFPRWIFDSITNCTEDRSSLFIAAPKTHFDLKGKKQKGKFGFFAVKEVEVKDPIVFRYVRGGVQILTKWGEEGQDPMLYNEIVN